MRGGAASSLAHALLELGQLVLDPGRDRGLRFVAAALLGGELLDPVRTIRTRLGQGRGRGGGGLVAEVEHVLADVAAELALLVADHVDEPHAEALADLDLAERGGLLAGGAALDEGLP